MRTRPHLAALALAVVAAIPGTAAADPPWASGHAQPSSRRDPCAGQSSDEVVGYSCRPLARWAPGWSGWLDLGAGGFHLPDDALAASRATGHLAGGDAAGGLMRIGADLPSGLYVVGEADFAGAGAASVMVDAAPATAHVIYGKLGVGVGDHVHLGAVTLGAELAPGLRLWSYNLPNASGSPTDLRPALDLRARAEAWLGPWASAGVQASADLVDLADVSVTLYLGLHLNGYDGR